MYFIIQIIEPYPFDFIFQAKKPLRIYGDWSEFKSSTGRKIDSNN